MINLQKWLQSNNEPNQQEYHPKQDPHHAAKFTCSLKRSSQRSSARKNLLEPKSHLVLAIKFKILALYRNLDQYWETEFGSPTKTNFTNQNLLEAQSHLVLAITFKF
jgi:hypothetical protein